MALVVGESTWITIAEADAYLTNRIGSSNWFDLSDDPVSPGGESKLTFLSMAFNLLVTKPGYGLYPTLVDTNVQKAQAEMALFLLNNYSSWEQAADIQARGVKSFTLSKWAETYFETSIGDASLPATVAMFLSEYRMDNDIVNLEVE